MAVTLCPSEAAPQAQRDSVLLRFPCHPPRRVAASHRGLSLHFPDGSCLIRVRCLSVSLSTSNWAALLLMGFERPSYALGMRLAHHSLHSQRGFAAYAFCGAPSFWSLLCMVPVAGTAAPGRGSSLRRPQMLRRCEAVQGQVSTSSSLVGCVTTLSLKALVFGEWDVFSLILSPSPALPSPPGTRATCLPVPELLLSLLWRRHLPMSCLPVQLPWTLCCC